jgi:hypothetical protein
MPMGGPGGRGAGAFQVIPLKHARARDLAETLKQVVGSVQAVGDTQSNSIVLKGDPADLVEIVDLIHKLDVAGDASGTGGPEGSGGAPRRPPGYGGP